MIRKLFSLLIISSMVTISLYAEDSIVKLNLIKKGKKQGLYALKLSVPNGYGVQIDAPNKLLLSGTDGITVKKANLKFRGIPNPKKKEYFLAIRDMPIILNGKGGSLEVNGKVYYCDYNANVCMFEKVQTKVPVP